MKVDKYEFETEWEYDIQDKWDFDFNVLRVSTRYWGRDNTAKPSIMLGEEKLVTYDGYIKGKDEQETRKLAEKWIKEQLEIIIRKLTN